MVKWKNKSSSAHMCSVVSSLISLILHHEGSKPEAFENNLVPGDWNSGPGPPRADQDSLEDGSQCCCSGHTRTLTSARLRSGKMVFLFGRFGLASRVIWCLASSFCPPLSKRESFRELASSRRSRRVGGKDWRGIVIFSGR